jgi:hypothetical protein
MHGSDRVPDLRDYKRAWVGKGKPFNESEMALFSECSLECARKVLDTADIVRDAIYRQPRIIVSESNCEEFQNNYNARRS